MITLYGFGPGAVLPDASPFVVKAGALLKMAGLPYRMDATGYRKAPKGKLPYIDDDGVQVADSTLIRFHIERKYGFDFDKGLSAQARGIAWAAEKLVEDNLYYPLKAHLWLNDANFKNGPASFFNKLPSGLRPLVRHLYRSRVKKDLMRHGIARHSDEDITQLGMRALDAFSAILSDKPYLMGEHPVGADAAVFPFLVYMLDRNFTSPVREHAEKNPGLAAYGKRMLARYYPDFPNV